MNTSKFFIVKNRTVLESSKYHRSKRRNPIFFLPTLHFGELSYILINVMTQFSADSHRPFFPFILRRLKWCNLSSQKIIWKVYTLLTDTTCAYQLKNHKPNYRTKIDGECEKVLKTLLQIIGNTGAKKLR